MPESGSGDPLSLYLSSVQRALERMTHAGIVSVSDMGLGAVVYEAIEQKPHHHLVLFGYCEDCQQEKDSQTEG